MSETEQLKQGEKTVRCGLGIPQAASCDGRNASIGFHVSVFLHREGLEFPGDTGEPPGES